MTIRPGTYQHFKGGLYTVIAEGRDSTTLERVVIYRGHETGEIWVRPLREWEELVSASPDGARVPRFTWFKD